MCNVSKPSPRNSKKRKRSINNGHDITVTIPSLSSYICPASAESPDTPDNDANDNFSSLLNALNEEEQKCVCAQNGYKKISKISDCLQGDMYKALNKTNGEYVAIKRASKELLEGKIAIDDGMNFCVSENLCKEAAILQYLTIHNRPLGDYIIQFVDVFEDEDNYYLVIEYVESETNLKQFVQRGHEYMADGSLSSKEYQKAIKYIMW